MPKMLHSLLGHTKFTHISLYFIVFAHARIYTHTFRYLHTVISLVLTGVCYTHNAEVQLYTHTLTHTHTHIVLYSMTHTHTYPLHSLFLYSCTHRIHSHAHPDAHKFVLTNMHTCTHRHSNMDIAENNSVHCCTFSKVYGHTHTHTHTYMYTYTLRCDTRGRAQIHKLATSRDALCIYDLRPLLHWETDSSTLAHRLHTSHTHWRWRGGPLISSSLSMSYLILYSTHLWKVSLKI